MTDLGGPNERTSRTTARSGRTKPLRLLDYIHAPEDCHFDLIYPREVRNLSDIHWTPVAVARCAAEFLVRQPGTRVLDIGCGPGKFCIVGALATNGIFTGVEQRKRLCDLGQSAIDQAGISNARIIHGNITQIKFSDFDAFYLFNPFEENLAISAKIDALVDLDDTLYDEYIGYVSTQLARAPLGTRVATYCGLCQEVPAGYECLEPSPKHGLNLWEKTSIESAGAKRLAAAATLGKRPFELEPVFGGAPS